MKTFLVLFLTFAIQIAQASISSPITFNADVRGFDKTWVFLVANKKNFRVHVRDWTELNGPVKTGPQKVSLAPRIFQLMKGDQLLTEK